MKLIRFATNALSTKKRGSNTPISPASLPSRAGALFFMPYSLSWQSSCLQKPQAAAVRIHPHENPSLLQTENRQRISTLAVFLWARVDYASRAAKNSPVGCFCPFFCDGAAAVRIHPHENPNFLQTKNRQRISTSAVFLWARVDYASRASKKAPQGLFSPPDCSAGRCYSNPPA